MFRKLTLILALFVAGCATKPVYHRYENPQPQDIKQLKKGQSIYIFTVDNKRIEMRYDSVTEYAVIGYVIEVSSGTSYAVVLADGDDVIDGVQLENIDVITSQSTRIEGNSFVDEVFAPPTSEEWEQLGRCLLLLPICAAVAN